MRIGTKSVLFGAHAFWIHPWVIAYAWWKLYGWRTVECRNTRTHPALWKPWLWVVFFVHDLGYLGKPNMDGLEGEAHPWRGANVLYWLQTGWGFILLNPLKTIRKGHYAIVYPWELSRRWLYSKMIGRQWGIWGDFSLYHSRYLAKKYNTGYSLLCVADKLAISLTLLGSTFRWFEQPERSMSICEMRRRTTPTCLLISRTRRAGTRVCRSIAEIGHTTTRTDERILGLLFVEKPSILKEYGNEDRR